MAAQLSLDMVVGSVNKWMRYHRLLLALSNTTIMVLTKKLIQLTIPVLVVDHEFEPTALE